MTCCIGFWGFFNQKPAVLKIENLIIGPWYFILEIDSLAHQVV